MPHATLRCSVLGRGALLLHRFVPGIADDSLAAALCCAAQMVKSVPLRQKVKIVKKRTAKFKRFQSDRFMRVPVS